MFISMLKFIEPALVLFNHHFQQTNGKTQLEITTKQFDTIGNNVQFVIASFVFKMLKSLHYTKKTGTIFEQCVLLLQRLELDENKTDPTLLEDLKHHIQLR